MSRSRFQLGLVAITAIAFVLRVLGVNWDQGLYLHPDERFVAWVTSDLRWPDSIIAYFNTATSPLNPYNTDHGSFIYGTLPVFLVKAIAGLVGRDSFGEVYLVGRYVSATADVITVILTALIAARLFNRVAGLIAGTLLAFTPLMLQSAHFYTVDTIAVTFTIAAFAAVLRSWDQHPVVWMTIGGAMIGLAGASKPNYLVTLVLLALPVLESVRTHGWSVLSPDNSRQVYPAIPAIITGGTAAFVTFRLAQPYAFAGPHWWNIVPNQRWLDDLAYWRSVQVGLVDMKPSIQWIGRTPVVYILQNMVLWGMGIVLGTLAIVALLMAVWRILRLHTWPDWWMTGIAAWCLANIALYGTGIAQNQRYLIHIYPFLVVLVAGLLVEVLDRLPPKIIANGLLAVVIGYTVIFGLAFDSLYIRPITRIAASDWIYQHIESGATISNEYWDDALPMPRPGQDRSIYAAVTLDLYADESRDDSKIHKLVDQLSELDYIVLSSNRVIDSVVRQPERYPVAVRYYEMLTSGELGFDLVAEFWQGPDLLGIEWDDRSAEESLIVYEHPQVRIFRKSESFDAGHVRSELIAAWDRVAYYYIPGDPLPQQMLMSDDAIAAQQDNGAWSGQVASGWWQTHPAVSWWIAQLVVGLLGWPLVWRAVHSLPDMGWALARSVGLIATAAVALALVTLGDYPLVSSAMWLGLLVLLALGFATRRCVWDDFLPQLRNRWRSVVISEVVFSGTFLFVLALRSGVDIAPDHHLAAFTGMMRSVSLPPIDPWLSDGLLHIRWAGLLPWAIIGRLLAIPSATALNLAIAGGVATLAAAIFGVLRRDHAPLGPAILAIGSVLAGVISDAWLGSSIGVPLSTLLLAAVTVVGLLLQPWREVWTAYLLIAATTGLLVVGMDNGLIIAIELLIIGFGVRLLQSRESDFAWWPSVRRFVLELAGVLSIGLLIWYPAGRGFTATARDMIPAQLWTLSDLEGAVGMIPLLGAFVVVAVGSAFTVERLLEQGSVGVLLVALISLVLVVMLVLAWWHDLGAMILMESLLLATFAMWHWHEQRRMLFSVGLIWISTALLLFVQIRPFHADPAGVSRSGDFVLVAGLLMLLGIGLALTTTSLDIFPEGFLRSAFAPVAFAVLLVAPTMSTFLSRFREPPFLSAQAQIQSTDDVLAAIQWLQAQDDGSGILLTAGGLEGNTISAVSGYPSVLGDANAERRMRPGWGGMIGQREQDVAFIYQNIRNGSAIEPLLQRYRVNYIVVGDDERARFGAGIDEAFAAATIDGQITHVFNAGPLDIYQVVTAPE